MRSSLAVLAVLLGSACTSGYSSGVEGGKPLSTLTPSEAALACENLNDYLLTTFSRDVTARFNCYVAALSTEVTPAACEAAFDACMTSPPTTPLNIEPLSCTGAGADPTCNATVSEVESCVTASTQAYRSRIDEVDCAIAGNLPELMRIQGALPTPAECSRLRTTCPAYADGIDGD